MLDHDGDISISRRAVALAGSNMDDLVRESTPKSSAKYPGPPLLGLVGAPGPGTKGTPLWHAGASVCGKTHRRGSHLW